MDNAKIQALTAEAQERHGQNHNCAQCVACTLAQVLDYSVEDAFRFNEGLGGGLGNRTQTCGAVLGAAFAISAANSDGYENRTTKAATYALEDKFLQEFEARFGGTICKDIRSTDDEKVREICEGYIMGATEIAANIINDLKA